MLQHRPRARPFPRFAFGVSVARHFDPVQFSLWAWQLLSASHRHTGHAWWQDDWGSGEAVLPAMPTMVRVDMTSAPRFSIATAQLVDAYGVNMTDAWCLHETDDIAVSVLHQESLAEKFQRLVHQWHTETDGLSSPTQITSNQAYLKIIALGPSIIPLILTELEGRGGYWYPALRAITDVNPVPETARGRPRLINEAWLAWGRKQEYIA